MTTAHTTHQNYTQTVNSHYFKHIWNTEQFSTFSENRKCEVPQRACRHYTYFVAHTQIFLVVSRYTKTKLWTTTSRKWEKIWRNFPTMHKGFMYTTSRVEIIIWAQPPHPNSGLALLRMRTPLFPSQTHGGVLVIVTKKRKPPSHRTPNVLSLIWSWKSYSPSHLLFCPLLWTPLNIFPNCTQNSSDPSKWRVPLCHHGFFRFYLDCRNVLLPIQPEDLLPS